MAHRTSPTLNIVQVATASLKPFATNPRLHPPEQIKLLCRGIRRFGFNNPVLVNPKYEIIAGHGRFLAAVELGISTLPCVILEHLSKAEESAYRIADNAIQLKGSWSPELLATEVAFILEADANLVVEDIGLEVPELDFLLDTSRKKKTARNKADEVPEVDLNGEPVTRLGDKWSWGEHAVICGNACETAVYLALLGERRAEAAISDPPWNIGRRVIGGKGKVRHPDFVMGAGEMSREEFTAFLQSALELQSRFSVPGALVMNFIDWRSVADMVIAGEPVFDRLENICVWVKPSGGMGGLWRSRHELVVVFRNKGGKHRNNVQLGKHGRNRTNVWEFPSPSVFGADRKNLKIQFHG